MISSQDGSPVSDFIQRGGPAGGHRGRELIDFSSLRVCLGRTHTLERPDTHTQCEHWRVCRDRSPPDMFSETFRGAPVDVVPAVAAGGASILVA